MRATLAVSCVSLSLGASACSSDAPAQAPVDASAHDSPSEASGTSGAEGGSSLVMDAAPQVPVHVPCSGPDTCPAPNAGIAFECEKRFLYGVNYPWRTWGYDFGGGDRGGIAWAHVGVEGALAEMHTRGVDVVRWWMFEEFNGDNGVALDSDGAPTGEAAGTLAVDIQLALQIAASAGVHYNFTLFSYDNFVESSRNRSLAPVVRDEAKRARLMQFVKAVAQIVETDPNKDRVVSWDVINEPEWAIGATDGAVDAAVDGGADPYGDDPFTSGSAAKIYDLINFTEMETFIRETVTTLHANSSALVTVGSAAVKWRGAWQHVGLDYYTVHMYDWVNQAYPYDTPVASFGFDRPVVLGEFPNEGLTGVSFATLVDTVFQSSVGYAGALSWAFQDRAHPWSGTDGGAANLESFAKTHPCVTAF